MIEEPLVCLGIVQEFLAELEALPLPKVDSSVEGWDAYTRAFLLAWRADEVCERTFERARSVPSISIGNGYPSIIPELCVLAVIAIQAVVP